jgi:hypothetical protein
MAKANICQEISAISHPEGFIAIPLILLYVHASTPNFAQGLLSECSGTAKVAQKAQVSWLSRERAEGD